MRVILGDTVRPATNRARIVLDSPHTTRCVPCSALPTPTAEQADELSGRVILRHRTRVETDDDGDDSYTWETGYDGPGIWSATRTVEHDDTAGCATEHATVTIPALTDPLETTASLWDHDQQRWTVEATTTTVAGALTLTISRTVDSE